MAHVIEFLHFILNLETFWTVLFRLYLLIRKCVSVWESKHAIQSFDVYVACFWSVCLSVEGSHHSNDSESNSPPAGQTGVPTQVVQQVQTAQVMHTHMYRWDIKAIQIKLNPKLWFVSSRGPWFRPQPRVKVDNWGSVICTSHLRYTHFITMILLHTCPVYVRSHLL